MALSVKISRTVMALSPLSYCSSTAMCPSKPLETHLIVVQIKASNVIGSSNFNDANIAGIKVQTEPVTPTNPPTVVNYNEQSVVLTMNQLVGD